MFRETRLGVKVGSHQECEFEEPTNIRNTNDNATSLVFFSGLVWFFCRACNIAPYFPDLRIKAKNNISFPRDIKSFPFGFRGFARRIVFGIVLHDDALGAAAGALARFAHVHLALWCAGTEQTPATESA